MLVRLLLAIGCPALLAACAFGTPANGEGRRSLPLETTWYWLGDADLISARIVRDPARYSLSLDRKDRARVQADCRRGTASVDSTTEGRLWLEKFAFDSPACGGASLSPAFVEALERAAVSEVRGNVMRMEQQQFGAYSYFALDPTASLAVYRCASSDTLAAVRIGDELKVWVGDELFALRRDVDGVPGRFAAGTLSWQQQGGTATLLRDGQTLHKDCRATG